MFLDDIFIPVDRYHYHSRSRWLQLYDESIPSTLKAVWKKFCLAPYDQYCTTINITL